MKPKQLLLTLLLILAPCIPNLTAATTTPPMEIHCKHFFYGYPLGTPASNDLIIRDIYALSNNDTTKFADWVAYRLTSYEVTRECDLTRVWRKDPWLDSNETLNASPDDYEGSSDALKVDRGHQAPLASFGGTRTWHETNYYSNITPQKSEANQGPWMHLENRERELVLTNQVIYVMTGPLYEKTMPPLPKAKVPHKVPSGYWKIIILQGSGNKFETAAFIFPQETGRAEKILSKLTSIDEIEKRSGLNFLWLLEDPLENEVEARINKTFAETYFKD